MIGCINWAVVPLVNVVVVVPVIVVGYGIV